jgi:hypothetical protein
MAVSPFCFDLAARAPVQRLGYETYICVAQLFVNTKKERRAFFLSAKEDGPLRAKIMAQNFIDK